MQAGQDAHTQHQVTGIDLAIAIDIAGNIQESGLVIQWISAYGYFKSIRVTVAIGIGIVRIGIYTELVGGRISIGVNFIEITQAIAIGIR